MLNFPVPYPDELLYSVIARYAVHQGIINQRQLLRDVFRDSKASATLDLPNRLAIVSEHYVACTGSLTSEDLAYRHTLLPLFAPFVPEPRRQQCLRWMGGARKGAIHLMLGVAARRLEPVRRLRFCPECIREQAINHGESYWRRLWMVPGTTVCHKHKAVYSLGMSLHETGKHQFVPATPVIHATGCAPVYFEKESIALGQQAKNLLNLDACDSPELTQWSAYYRHLAKEAGCCRGAYIDYAAIRERVASCWSDNWLSFTGLKITDADTNWLRSIFRKHRKSFSYLEHIVAMESLIQGKWTIKTELEKTRNMPNASCSVSASNPSCSVKEPSRETALKQSWELLLCKHGVQYSRKLSVGKRIYAWLYRHDHDWLLAVNKRYRRTPTKNKRIVDWSQRDRDTARKLIRFHRLSLQNPLCKRRSRNFYLNSLENRVTIEKNFERLPHCKTFLCKYAETVADFQIRRITLAVNELKGAGEELKVWRIFRLAGLSSDRITDQAASHFAGLYGSQNDALD